MLINSDVKRARKTNFSAKSKKVEDLQAHFNNQWEVVKSKLGGQIHTHMNF